MEKEIKSKENLEKDVLYIVNLLVPDLKEKVFEEIVSKEYSIKEAKAEIRRLIQKGYVREGLKHYELTEEGLDRLLDLLRERTVSFRDALKNLLTRKWEKITCTTWSSSGSFYKIGRCGYSIVDENGEEQTDYSLRSYDLKSSGWKEYKE